MACHLQPALPLCASPLKWADPNLRADNKLDRYKLQSATFRPAPQRGSTIEKNSRRFTDGERIADDTKYYVRCVAVLQGGREAGRIWLEQQYRYRSDDRKNYVIKSLHINNGRKGNQSATTKIDVAVRNAKKYFEAPKNGELLYDEMGNAIDMFQRCIQNLSYNIRRDVAFYGNRGTMAQMYLHSLFNGLPIDLAHEAELRATFTGDKFKTDLEHHLLGESMAKHKFKFIHVIDGDYCFFTGDDIDPSTVERGAAGKAEVTSCAFDELPETWQNRLGVLQLMKDCEIVLDTGYRHNQNTFIIVE